MFCLNLIVKFTSANLSIYTEVKSKLDDSLELQVVKVVNSLDGLLNSMPTKATPSVSVSSPIEEIWVPYCHTYAKRVAAIQDKELRDNIMKGMKKLF